MADSTRDALVAQLHDVWDSLIELGTTLTDSDWATPTPCPGWPVAAQYAHMIGTESMLLQRPNPESDGDKTEKDHVRNQIGGFNEVWVDHLAGKSRTEVLEVFAEVIGARKEALAAMTEDDFSAPSWTPVGQADYRRFMQIRVFDCWVHEQDIRDGIGRVGHESGPAAEQAVDEIARAAGYLVGKKAGVPAGSGVSIVLTGPVERHINVEVGERAKVVDALSTDPTATITLSSTAFTRLACGRIDPAQVEDGALGGVRLTGDEDLGQRVVANLAFTI
ncbi:MAG TPA: maleylpyruvate isomerase family mycothiol-dependent enzyme [Acidimicrobiales bacterium]|jgi:uncharacterized protein (TIGR03083 family)|nr:maleylpyruvate isomerase family mycothiol-dependent enzyme [Acidimicrobiales bacterium]